MPYITRQQREDLKYRHAATSGELNYQISMLVSAFIEDNGKQYSTFNDVIGALEGAKLEVYRRKVAEYEDEKINENGDID